MIGLQQIHALGADERIDAFDVVRTIELLSQDRGAERFAGAVRHGAIPTGHADKRCRFAFAPTRFLPGSNTNQQGILAAIAHVAHHG
jgi:hypothetical protein